MGGKARLKKDLRYLQKMQNKQADLEMAQQFGDDKKAAKLQKQLDRHKANVEYIGSTVRGAGGYDDVKSWYDTKKEGARIHDEFVDGA